MCQHAKSLQLCLTIDHVAPLFMGLFRQEYRSGLPFPLSGDLPYPGIELVSLVSPALQEDSLPLNHQEIKQCSI